MAYTISNPICQTFIWVYNIYMTPRQHFANLRQSDPVAYRKGSDQVWNTFVSVTHKIGLSSFFSFTPDFSEYRAKNGGDQENPDTKSL